MNPAPEDWYTIEVSSPTGVLLQATTRAKDYDAVVHDTGVLQVMLVEHGEIHLYAPGEWSHFAARPTPQDIATNLNREEP